MNSGVTERRSRSQAFSLFPSWRALPSNWSVARAPLACGSLRAPSCPPVAAALLHSMVGRSAPVQCATLRVAQIRRRRASRCSLSIPPQKGTFLCSCGQTKVVISLSPPHVIMRSSRRTRSLPFNSGRDPQARTALGYGTTSFRSGQACASLQYALASLRPGQSQRSDLADARSERRPPLRLANPQAGVPVLPPPRCSSSSPAQSWHWPAGGWSAPPRHRWLRSQTLFFTALRKG